MNNTYFQKVAAQNYYSLLSKATRRINPKPSLAQQEAGNYRMGHINIHGLPITIETPRGNYRKRPNFKTLMHHHYGYFKRTEGGDGENIDVYIGTNLKAPNVFIIDQKDKDSNKFDEHKVMLGFNSKEEAKQEYLKHFPKYINVFGAITELSIDEFKDWLKNGDTTIPVANKIKVAKIEVPNILTRILNK